MGVSMPFFNISGTWACLSIEFMILVMGVVTPAIVVFKCSAVNPRLSAVLLFFRSFMILVISSSFVSTTGSYYFDIYVLLYLCHILFLVCDFHYIQAVRLVWPTL